MYLKMSSALIQNDKNYVPGRGGISVKNMHLLNDMIWSWKKSQTLQK